MGHVTPFVEAEKVSTKPGSLQSWAHVFRERILPLIDEELFRGSFSSVTGRPNKSVRLLTALHLLKEINDLTDEQVLDQLEFNLQWHYALGVEPRTAHTCQKSLHNFRVRLLGNEQAQQMFAQITRAMAEADGLHLGAQRIDSTHVMSNIAVLTRLGLFVETVTAFLQELRRALPDRLDALDAGYRSRYLDREGYFSDAKREQARRRLPVVAEDLHALLHLFENDREVASLPTYGLLARLFAEQCEVVENSDDDEDGNTVGDEGGNTVGDDDADPAGSSGSPRVRLREPATIASDSLQSPYDADATYGHKGKGYEVQVAETCAEGNAYQLITGVHVNGAHESDHNALVPMLDQLEAAGMKPDEMLGDTSYGSGANIVASADRGVALVAPVQDPDAPARRDPFMTAVQGCATETETGEPTPPRSAVAAETTEPTVESVGHVDGSMAATPSGLAAFVFASNFREVIECPAGHVPVEQHVAGKQLIAIFPAEHCDGCPLAQRCPTRRLKDGARQLRRAPATIATQIRQAEQRTPEFKERYKIRSGIESTNNELKGRHGAGDLRVRGKTRVELAMLLKSLAVNVKRAIQHHVTTLTSTPNASCPA